MDEKTRELLNNLSFDAALAYRVVIQELIVELVEGGALSPKGAANVLVRAESVIRNRPGQDIQRVAFEALSEPLQRRLALQPDVAARRLDDPKEQASRPRGPKNMWEYEARLKRGENLDD